MMRGVSHPELALNLEHTQWKVDDLSIGKSYADLLWQTLAVKAGIKPTLEAVEEYLSDLLVIEDTPVEEEPSCVPEPILETIIDVPVKVTPSFQPKKVASNPKPKGARHTPTPRVNAPKHYTPKAESPSTNVVVPEVPKPKARATTEWTLADMATFAKTGAFTVSAPKERSVWSLAELSGWERQNKSHFLFAEDRPSPPPYNPYNSQKKIWNEATRRFSYEDGTPIVGFTLPSQQRF